MRLPALLFAIGLVAAIAGDRFGLAWRPLYLGLIAFGGVIGWLAARWPLTGRSALMLTGLLPVGAALASAFC